MKDDTLKKMVDACGDDPDFDIQEVYMGNTTLDGILSGQTIDGPKTSSVRELTDSARSANALPTPPPAGERVRFIANLGSVLTYDDVPGDGLIGTVVTVKTADGNVTAYNGKVFVLWDDDKFRPIFAEHLRAARTPNKQARSFRMVMSDWNDVATYFDVVGGNSDELVHKATKDLWAVKKNKDSYVIERLFKEDGKPLKV